jgi:hypothetical protein
MISGLGARQSNVFRYDEDSLKAALKNSATAGGFGELEYFFCHAGTEAAPDESWIKLTKKCNRLELWELPIDEGVPGNPVIVLNACESGQLDGRFYDSFVRSFLSGGASVVIGTEMNVPATFGAQFGAGLLRAVFSNTSIGEALRQQRIHFLQAYGYPWGLLYRVWGNADVCFT